MFEDLKKRAYEANMALYRYGIAPFTWGNASECDRSSGVFAIKPSGVPYEQLTPEKMVIVDFDGHRIEGAYNPSSDTPTHAVLFSRFPSIGGVVHTHSVYAVAFAQAGLAIPSLGTTHADFCRGSVPCTPKLSREQVENAYEANTGEQIVRYFKDNSLDENAVPAVLVQCHGPFCWGKDAASAAITGATLEIVAQMALLTLGLRPGVSPIDSYLSQKHYDRKHGKNAYYGQRNDP